MCACAGKVLPVILDRLAAIERQQRVHTEMLNNILQAVTRRTQVENCELPEDILPLECMNNLRRLEKKLSDSAELKALLVRFGC